MDAALGRGPPIRRICKKKNYKCSSLARDEQKKMKSLPKREKGMCAGEFRDFRSGRKKKGTRSSPTWVNAEKRTQTAKKKRRGCAHLLGRRGKKRGNAPYHK